MRCRNRAWLYPSLSVFLLAAVACKQEEAPKPAEKPTTPTMSPPVYPQPSYPQPALPEEEEESEFDSSSGCSSSSCKDPGTLRPHVDGSKVDVLDVGSEANKTWTLTVESARYDDRTFLLDVKSDSPNLKVTDNESSSVTLTWVPTANTTEGQLQIRARDERRCELETSDDGCSDLGETNEFDEGLTLPWSTNGSVPGTDGLGGLGGTGDSTNDLLLSFGLKFLAKFLGMDDGPATFLGGATAGVIGGGLANGAANGANGWNAPAPSDGTAGTCSKANCAACAQTQCAAQQCTWDTTNNVCR